MADKLELKIPALSVISVVPKFMGKFPEDWHRHLQGISGREYNMVHFTPLQELGQSKSPYSLFDQTQFDKSIFPNGERDVAELIKTMEDSYGLLALTDVVLNHTADNSKWLEEHPEAGYNLETAPWLESALELDNALLDFGDKLAEYGLPTDIQTEDQLQAIMVGIQDHVITKIKLWEYYAVDVQSGTDSIVAAYAAGKSIPPQGGFGSQVGSGVGLVKSMSLYDKASLLKSKGMLNGLRIDGRGSRAIHPEVGAALLTAILGIYDAATHHEAQDVARSLLNEVNLPFYREYDEDVRVIKDQISGRLRYMLLESNGPKLGPITKNNPLFESYFVRLPVNHTTKQHHPKALSLVCNGWIWAADAMKDNAGPDWRPYLRREVIPWSDCVKLRYGKGPEDSPWLWEFMSEYVRIMAKHFAAFRIDNCHSTPLHVAEYFMDMARQVRPNLAIFAELFTGNEETDYVFVKRLKLSALIREAMQCWSAQELSRIVHRNGGRPIGSFERDMSVQAGEILLSNSAVLANGNKTVKSREVIKNINPSEIHALFMDCTHDNEMPAQKRTARDTLPQAALVNMCACATGSVFGYDEIYPCMTEIVHETRVYQSPSSEGEVQLGAGEGGIAGIKKLFNRIHTMMGKDGYDETHIHHDGELITVHRVHPRSRKGYYLIAHTAFPGSGNGNGGLPPVHLIGTRVKQIGAWTLEVDDSEIAREQCYDNPTLLTGLPSRTKNIKGFEIEHTGDDSTITVPEYFPPGSIALFETWIPSAEHSEGLSRFIASSTDQAFGKLDLIDLNFLLYRCEAEERESSGGSDGCYSIPGMGSLVYAGLQGWWSVLEPIVQKNDLGHPMCNHLREGQWAYDHVVGRLIRVSQHEGFSRLQTPATWLRERFDAIRNIPSFLQPHYFAMIIQIAYAASWGRAMSLFSKNVQNGPKFLQSLAMTSVQMQGYVGNGSLWPFKKVPSVSAGLPHFSVDWARCWGRDVFISLRGLFLCTGRFEEARDHIVAFGSVLKHGLIPNLLSSGSLPRYNSRDSPWFFLQSIQDYVNMVPDGISLLKIKVPRRFLPYDDTWFPHDDPRAYSTESTVEDLILEILQQHATGQHFREYNAGSSLDMQMTDAGFNIDIEVDWKTGIIFGGNQHNCGTWMDKMGESTKARNKGVPGTPRDGAAVEITGLVYSALTWVAGLNDAGHFTKSSVTNKNGHISFKDWASSIRSNFEKCYWVPLDPKEDADFNVDAELINRRGIYKDCYKSGKPFEDYQLRPNFAITMTVAPDLFNPERVFTALKLADQHLRGPIGMATLDPSDLNYRPYYHNSDDSDDFATAKGRNYHQGPEWGWPLGFHLRAIIEFGRRTRHDTTQLVNERIEECADRLETSAWRGLPELTQRHGGHCGDSCESQAWSSSCLVDVLFDAGV